MKKYKLYLYIIAVLAGITLLLNMKNISKNLLYILIGIAGIAIGFGATKLFTKCKAEQVFVPGEVVYKDTCINKTLLCTITTQDSMNIYRIIRQGIKVKETNTRPKIESVRYADTIYQDKPLFERLYTKSFNNGVCQLWDSVTVVGEIIKWNRSHQLDTTLEIREKVTNHTVILKDSTDESGSIRYIPLETHPKQTWVGLGASFKYDNKPIPEFGSFISSGKTSVGLFVAPLEGFDKISSYRLQVSRQLIRVSSK